jgi:hypothetical protein
MALSLAASAPASSRASFHRVALPAETAMLSVTSKSRFVTIVVDWEEFACREMKVLSILLLRTMSPVHLILLLKTL